MALGPRDPNEIWTEGRKKAEKEKEEVLRYFYKVLASAEKAIDRKIRKGDLSYDLRLRVTENDIVFARKHLFSTPEVFGGQVRGIFLHAKDKLESALRNIYLRIGWKNLYIKKEVDQLDYVIVLEYPSSPNN
jgi:hypothetical protein